jgi:CheY-like chemotaxis protein
VFSHCGHSSVVRSESYKLLLYDYTVLCIHIYLLYAAYNDKSKHSIQRNSYSGGNIVVCYKSGNSKPPSIRCYNASLIMKLILEDNGFKVDSFTDASQALENFTAGLYDLVILDVKLPGMDGFSVYTKIKKLDDKVRICFLTAADKAYYEILKKHYSGIKENCVIYKPVENESLLKLIKSVLWT